MRPFALLISLLVLAVPYMPVNILMSQQQKKETTEDSFHKARKYFFERKFEMAELLLQESLKQNPENKTAYSYLGDIFLQKKNFDSALTLYKRVAEIDPSDAENFFRMGQVYYYKKIPALSIDNYKKALELNSNLKFTYYNLGLTYLMLSRDKQNTIRSWESYLRVAPEDPQYEKIRRVIELLRDPNFVLPPADSDISIEEALHLGGATLKSKEHEAKQQKADHEQRKTKTNIEEVYRDDEL